MGTQNSGDTILKKYADVLTPIQKDRVFSVEKGERGWYIGECCDEWFSHSITSCGEAMRLSKLFAEIAQDIKRCKGHLVDEE